MIVETEEFLAEKGDDGGARCDWKAESALTEMAYR
jgi:hypothetical protein